MNIFRLDEDQREEIGEKRMIPLIVAFIIGGILAIGFIVYMWGKDFPFILLWIITMFLVFAPPYFVFFLYGIKNSWDYITVQNEREKAAKEKRFKALRKRREDIAKLESGDALVVWQARDENGELYMYLNEPTLENDGTWKDYITESRIKLPNHASKVTFRESPKRYIVDNAS